VAHINESDHGPKNWREPLPLDMDFQLPVARDVTATITVRSPNVRY